MTRTGRQIDKTYHFFLSCNNVVTIGSSFRQLVTNLYLNKAAFYEGHFRSVDDMTERDKCGNHLPKNCLLAEEKPERKIA